MTDKLPQSEDYYWYKDAIIYELHIKAFKDNNDDGVGDFKGLLEKLDYLQDLGVTAIWLLPFYPSPLRDDGYDIADYYTINPTYGEMRDLKKFLKEAHKRDMKVITELVINHTSDQHPWFQRARKAKPGSRFRNYYVWSDDPDKYKDVRIIFQDYEASNWTWDPEAKSYYWHRFFHHQPDLNYDNPEVQEEIFRIMDFWCKLGVDGFRLDAVPYLFEEENTNCENLPKTHLFLQKLRKHVDSKFDNVLLLAEANMWPEDSASYFGEGDECQMNYHFPIMPRMFMALKMEDRYPIIDIIEQTPEIPKSCQWGIFLRNHDELTLEMVTDEERDYMYKVYTKESLARINLGIRHRLAPLLDNDRKKMELMNFLLFSLPGTPIIYYGDEIGMGDNYYLGDRDGVRTPMQWNADRNAGFSKANPQKLYLPTILDPEYNYEAVNVETQRKNTSSLWWWMKRVIDKRKHYKAFGWGDISFLSPANSKIIAFTRSYEDQIILVVANLSRFSQPVELDLEEFHEYIPVEIFSQNKFPIIKKHPYLLTLGPHGYYWFHLRKEARELDQKRTIPEFKADSIDSFLENTSLSSREEKMLENYIFNCRWFGGKARSIQKIELEHNFLLKNEKNHYRWLVLKINYYEGLPEYYQLPLTARNVLHDPGKIPENQIVASLISGEDSLVVFEAILEDHFRDLLLRNIFAGKKLSNGGEFVFSGNRKNLGKKREISSKILKAEQSNTAVMYGDEFFLKLYRKIDHAMNPDLEITRFLTEKAGFRYVPDYAGAIFYKEKGSSPMVLGMLTSQVKNHGDAWEYFTDAVKRYLERIRTNSSPREVPPALIGSLFNPPSGKDIPKLIYDNIGTVNLERIDLLGKRTAEMHLALENSSGEKDFKPEEFSLHYQRSLYSSLRGMVRESFHTLQKSLKRPEAKYKKEGREVLNMKKEVLDYLKNIYSHKLDALKIRNHGDYHLGQVLFTGKDFIIIDFEGEPLKSYSERRIKRSPLRDVAGMIRSFHYAAYNHLLGDALENKQEEKILENWADQWYHYVTGCFLNSYYEHIKDSRLIPADPRDRTMLLEIFILEKAIYEINYELNNRPDWVVIPFKGIKSILSGLKK